MYQSKKAIEDRKEIIAIVKATFIKQREIEIKPAIASLSLETGYSKAMIREIFETLAETGFIHIGKNGVSILTGGEKNDCTQDERA